MNIFERVMLAFQKAKEENTCDMSLEQEFIKELAIRRMSNRAKFIESLTQITISKCYEDTGVIMDKNQAKMFAIALFEKAKAKGDIDILNRLKGEDNE